MGVIKKKAKEINICIGCSCHDCRMKVIKFVELAIEMEHKYLETIGKHIGEVFVKEFNKTESEVKP